MPSAKMPGESPQHNLAQPLTIELVPATSWFANVRSHVSHADWERCKRYVRNRSGDYCEICGARGPRWPVECHEVWRYDLPTETQVLDDLIALCPDCHRVKHMGHTRTLGDGPFRRAVAHYARVNRLTTGQAIHDIAAAFTLWRIRSEFYWSIDFSWLERELGITEIHGARTASADSE